MGSNISIDKHTSSLKDILKLNPVNLAQANLQQEIPEHITQHIKIWRFHEDEESQQKNIKSSPVKLEHLQSQTFNFSSNECYLVFLVQRTPDQNVQNSLNLFPQNMWGVVESYNNLTPRGLEVPVAESDDGHSRLESFLLPQSRENINNKDFQYMIYVWNGKNTNAFNKSLALSSAFKLEKQIVKGGEKILHIFFSGGVIKDRKLYKGQVIPITTGPQEKRFSKKVYQDIKSMSQQVYLFKFIFPQQMNGISPPQSSDRESQKQQQQVQYNNLVQNQQNNGDQVMQQNGRQQEQNFPNFINMFLTSNNNQENFAQQQQQENQQNQQQFEEGAEIQNKLEQVQQLDLPQDQQQFQPRDQQQFPGENNCNSLNYFQNFVGFNEEQYNFHQQYNYNQQQMPDSHRSSEEFNQMQDDQYQNQQYVVEQQPQENLQRGNNRQGMFLNLGNLNQNTNPPKNNNQQLPQIEQFDVIDDDLEDDTENQQYIQPLEPGKSNLNMQIKQQEMSVVCSEVVEGQLYLSGVKVATNLDQLLENGITHIINSAANLCPSRFPDHIIYKNYYLLDQSQENIESVFYDCFQFIEEAISQGGRVLVHCQKGVSRSVSICMAYLIWKNQLSFDDALSLVKSRREIASPNIGFIAQLQQFSARIIGKNECPFPRVFMICSHSKQDPQLVVAKKLIEGLYGQHQYKTLDERGIFLVQGQESIYVWIGSKCVGVQREQYDFVVQQKINQLQEYENSTQNVIFIEQGQEDDSFWNLWGFETQPQQYLKIVGEWDNFLLKLEPEYLMTYPEPVLYYKNEQQESEDQAYELEQQQKNPVKPKLFFYSSEIDKPLNVIEQEYFEDGDFWAICYIEDNILKQFIFKKASFICENKNIEQEFGQNIVEQYYNKNQIPFEDVETIIESSKEDIAELDPEFLNRFTE